MEVKMIMKGSSQQRDLMIKELIEGVEAARQLQKRILISPNKRKLGHNDDHDHQETNPPLEEDDQAVNHSLLDKMLASFDKTIAIAKLIKLELDQQPDNHQQQQPSDNSHSNHSLDLGSPRSENSHYHLHLSKKRKMMPTWSTSVTVKEGKSMKGLEVPPDDGFTWRKYGQKEILGTKHPRAYYRCTHRPTQGCTATKQVQRSDNDPFVFDITYRGMHTCSPGGQSRPKKQAQIKIVPKPQSPLTPQAQHQMDHSPEPEIYLGLDQDGALKVEPTEDETPTQLFRSFSFNPGLLESGPTDNFALDYCLNFGSPENSESNHFPPIGPGAGLNVQTSESDLNGTISGPDSVTNSPMGGDFEFFVHLPDINPDFSIGW